MVKILLFGLELLPGLENKQALWIFSEAAQDKWSMTKWKHRALKHSFYKLWINEYFAGHLHNSKWNLLLSQADAEEAGDAGQLSAGGDWGPGQSCEVSPESGGEECDRADTPGDDNDSDNDDDNDDNSDSEDHDHVFNDIVIIINDDSDDQKDNNIVIIEIIMIMIMMMLFQHQNPQQLSANLWAAVRARGCQFLGPAMQEEVLKLVLLALEEGSALSRKVSSLNQS